MNKKLLAILGVVAAAVVAFLLLRSPEEKGPAKTADDGAETGGAAATRAGGSSTLPAPARVSGTVSDAEGTSIEGAQVVATRIEEGPPPDMAGAELSAVTGQGGTFELRDLPPGDYAVSAATADHLPRTEVISLAPGDDKIVQLQLEGGGALLAGTVRDLTGGNVAGAIVAVAPMRGVLGFQEREVAAALTGDDGGYAIRLLPGRYRARAAHPDYVGASAVFDITEGGRSLDLSLAPGGVIEGVALRGDDRSPVPGALVSYAVERAGGPPGRGGMAGVAVADSRGTFRITGLSPGLVRLSGRGGMLATTGAELVPLGVAEQTSGVELLLEGARRVSGQVVVSGSGDPAPGVEVSARARGGGFPVSTTSDANGRFELLGLAPGSYRVSTSSEKFFGDRMGTPIELGDENVDDLELHVRRGATVRGTVAPPGRSSVQAYQERETMDGTMRLPVMGGQADTADDGVFEIGPLEPGTFELEARDASGRRGSVTVDVPSEGKDGVTIELEEGAIVSGRVVNSKGAPVGDALVRVRPKTSKGRVTMIVNGRELTAFEGATDENGNYSIVGLEAGSYEVEVGTSYGEPLRWDDGSRKPRPTQVAALEKKTLNLSVESRDGVIEGVVVDGSGQPVPDAWVRIAPSLEPPGGAEEGQRESRMVMITEESSGGIDGQRPPALTDETGSFRFAGLREGSYSLIAEALRGGARGYTRAATGESARVEVFELTRLSGTVTLDGKPVELFRVSLDGPSQISRGFRTQDGSFELPRIDPGMYKVSVNANGGQGKAEIEVRSGEEANVTVSLSRGVRVRGVLQSKGEPVVGAVAVAVAKRTDGRMMVEIDSDDVEGRTRADGRFEIGVAPGDYMMLFIDLQGGQGPVARRELKVSGDEPVIDLGVVEAGEPDGGGDGRTSAEEENADVEG